MLMGLVGLFRGRDGSSISSMTYQAASAPARRQRARCGRCAHWRARQARDSAPETDIWCWIEVAAAMLGVTFPRVIFGAPWRESGSRGRQCAMAVPRKRVEGLPRPQEPLHQRPIPITSCACAWARCAVTRSAHHQLTKDCPSTR